ncbi:MAG TPA: type II secretion system protein GspG [Capsulimonadaceae bacterium]|nr:type II secretion system protein GspG [Capsulimonadaceae bacterium]
MNTTLKLQLIRLVIALVFGIAVFGLALRAAWVAANGSPFIDLERYYTWDKLRVADSAIDDYRNKHGTLPASFAVLCSSKDLEDQICQFDGTLLDGWHRPFQYRVTGGDYIVISYGRDGKGGGIGLDADLSNKSLRWLLPLIPFNQFIHLPASNDMILTA